MWKLRKMTISILTLFPEMFAGPFDHSIIRRAKDKNIVHINFVNIRDFSSDTYKTVDDHPYGGGVGMIMRVDVVNRALEHMKALCKRTSCKTILLDPQGTPYTQAKAKELSSIDHLILICGHYEGVDERVRSLVDETISIGDFIVTGGEIPAMVLIDSVVRLLPGVLKRIQRHWMNRLRSRSSSIRSIQDRKNLTAWLCRMSCYPAITQQSISGKKFNNSPTPKTVGRTS